MIRSKLFAMITMVLFFLGVGTLGSALAGEKQKWHGTGVTTKWEQIEVGDEKGHVLAIMQNKQVFINDQTGEKMPSISTNIIDFNPKAKLFSVRGYGVTKYPNGDMAVRAHEGKAVGKGHMKGTYSYINGTGKYEGVTGGGTWESWTLAPEIAYYEVEGEMVIPK